MKKNIGIVKYGIGNYTALKTSLVNNGFKVVVSNLINDLDKVDILILPGVGAFETAIKNIIKDKLFDFLKQKSIDNKPIVGICLGMQLLASSSLENGIHQGLDIIPGQIKPLNKIHVGWSKLKFLNKKKSEKFTIKDKYFYFNHNYFFEGKDDFILATLENNTKCPSIIKFRNNVGLQFHPEKSQLDGNIFFKLLLDGFEHD